MKKITKILGQTLAVVMVVVTAFLLTACGNEAPQRTFVKFNDFGGISGSAGMDGDSIWHVGGNTYATTNGGSNTYQYDPVDRSWSLTTHINLPPIETAQGFNPMNIWYDGTDTYYSYCVTYNQNETPEYRHYKREADGTWSEKKWYNLVEFEGKNVWSDGENIYYSCHFNNNLKERQQYVLDRATSTWQPMAWNYLTVFDGENIWTDGTDIYYADAFVLDVEKHTWTPKEWPAEVWGDLDPNTMVWSKIWTDGNNIFYSNKIVSPFQHYIFK